MDIKPHINNMNAICEHKYSQFKHILSGCRSILDAYHFADLYTKKHPEMRNIIYSMVNGKRYETVLDFRTMKNVLFDIDKTHYQENADEISEKMIKKTSDATQIKTLLRASKSKPLMPVQNIETKSPQHDIKTIRYIKIKQFDYETYADTISKPCPHCNHECNADTNASYVVCGYSDPKVGYDWDGCGCDWCFRCGKILCKSWENNKLFVDQNCIHDDVCCRKHAKEHGKHYPNDYCQCNNEHVKRNIIA